MRGACTATDSIGGPVLCESLDLIGLLQHGSNFGLPHSRAVFIVSFGTKRDNYRYPPMMVSFVP